eukprot:TRINITY_DN40892_c0_g1_i1.p1 TRINITY_DN40892_c0_g1~~TRINITY_DN40892_c0_g1_i1.p1  ORF type:complete len:784 (-),score=180.56 TRINITY_DN40892_c0_g1_i1:467-2818(-)
MTVNPKRSVELVNLTQDMRMTREFVSPRAAGFQCDEALSSLKASPSTTELSSSSAFASDDLERPLPGNVGVAAVAGAIASMRNVEDIEGSANSISWQSGVQPKRPFLKKGSGKLRSQQPLEQKTQPKGGVSRRLRLQPREAFKEAARAVAAASEVPFKRDATSSEAVAGRLTAISGNTAASTTATSRTSSFAETPPQRPSARNRDQELTPDDLPLPTLSRKGKSWNACSDPNLRHSDVFDNIAMLAGAEKKALQHWQQPQQHLCPEEVVRQLQLEADLHLRALDSEIEHFHQETEAGDRLCALDREIERFRTGSQALQRLKERTEGAEKELQREREMLKSGLEAERRQLQLEADADREEFRQERRRFEAEVERQRLADATERLELRSRLDAAREALSKGDSKWQSTLDHLRHEVEQLTNANASLQQRLAAQQGPVRKNATSPLRPCDQQEEEQKCDRMSQDEITLSTSCNKQYHSSGNNTNHVNTLLQQHDSNRSIAVDGRRNGSDTSSSVHDQEHTSNTALESSKRERSSRPSLRTRWSAKGTSTATSSSKPRNSSTPVIAPRWNRQANRDQKDRVVLGAKDLTDPSETLEMGKKQQQQRHLQQNHESQQDQENQQNQQIPQIQQNQGILEKQPKQQSHHQNQQQAEQRKTVQEELQLSTEKKSREIVFANGLRKTVWPDGRTSVLFPNGDVKEHLKDGTIVYRYCATHSVQTTYPDGTNVFCFASGQLERHFPDGSKHVEFPDGTVKKLAVDGTEEVTFPDGAVQVTPAVQVSANKGPLHR